jgi:hypothetical protein
MKSDKIDWALAKVLFNQGLTSSEIAERVGCSRSAVTSRMSRDQWSDERDQIATLARSVAITRAADSLAEGAKRWVGRMVRDIESTMDALQECPPEPSLRQLMERESVLEKLNKRARTTFGLDSESKTTVQIAFFSSGPKPEPQAVDVQEVKPTTEPDCPL